MSENYWYSSLSGQEIEDTLLGAVRFNADQTLTTSQKAAARANIGAGEANSTFKILGYFDTLEDLQEWLQVLPQSGDAYGIGTESPYDVYVYDGIHSEWVNNGPIAYSDALIDDNDISIDHVWSSSKTNAELVTKQAKINASGMLKGTGNGAVSAATLGEDYTAVDDTLNSSTVKTYSIDKIKSLEPTGIVHYDQAQSLTDAQKTQARDNIDATGKWQLLWTNPSPSADFAAQTVPLDLSAYSEFVITYRQWKADPETSSNQQYFFGYAVKTVTIMTPITSNSQVYLAAREVTISSTGITFGAAASKTSLNGNATTDNGWIVPYQIYAR